MIKYKKRKPFSSEYEMRRATEKQRDAWNSLIIGDKEYESCGEPWETWNTVTIPIRIKMKAILAARKIMNIIKRYDEDGDGVVSKADCK